MYERAVRGLNALAEYDPLYWADHGPDAIALAQGIHISALRTDSDARPPVPPSSLKGHPQP